MEPWMIWTAAAAGIIGLAALVRWALRGEAEIDATIADLERQVYGEDRRG